MNLLDTFNQIDPPRVLVLGDLILDRYTFGNAERVSPEAPVLVLEADQQEVRPGGAASVAALLRGFDAEVSLAGVISEDASGRTLQGIFRDASIDHRLVLSDPERPTTTKERYIGRAANRHPYQILRVDHEVREPIGNELEERLVQGILDCLGDFNVLLVSDYAKGVCTPGLLERVITAARALDVPVIVDPAKAVDYERYRGATILTPNRAEAERATGRKIDTPQDALTVGKTLCARLGLQAVLITLDSDGMALVTAGGAGEIIPTRPRSVYDVTGAGDMVLAMVGLCQAGSVNLKDSVRLANIAAGLEVEKLGVAPISRDEILAELRGTGSSTEKLVTLERMCELAEDYRRDGKKIVFTNGCFDLLHVGHTGYLQQAAELGDVLIVAVNSDSSVKQLKGPERPVINQESRAALLAALGCVDHVLIFDEETPHRLLHALRPDVLVKGGTTLPDQIVGREIVDGYGGQIVVTSAVPGISTTEILNTALLRNQTGIGQEA